MGTKIQINSVRALETLLAADSEFEVEFRKSVLKEYERTHILPSIKEELGKIVSKLVRQEIVAASSSWSHVTLKKDVKDKIETVVHQLVQQKVNSTVNGAVDRVLDEHSLQKILEEKAQQLVETLTVQRVKARIHQAVDEVLKEK